MVWNAVALPCVEVADFIGFCDFLVNLIEAKNGFEIRYTFKFLGQACWWHMLIILRLGSETGK